MLGQHINNGIVTIANGAESADVKIQTFDRDLPCSESRASSVPQILGEAISDAKERFQLTYTLEQFSNDEGISQFRRLREKNAGLRFRNFERTRRDLNIKDIEALNREYCSDQIIVNAPILLEVSIFLDAPLESGTSKFEQLVALIAPVVQNLLLIKPSDVVFQGNELGLDRQ